MSSAMSKANSSIDPITDAGYTSAGWGGLHQTMRNWMTGDKDWARQNLAANKQMDFQREMSNTAYQRSVRDMKAAGLNPALMFGSGSASSSPSGSTGSAAGQSRGNGVASAFGSLLKNMSGASVTLELGIPSSLEKLNAPDKWRKSGSSSAVASALNLAALAGKKAITKI